MKHYKTEAGALKNGLTVLSEYLPYSESFSLGITVKAGSYFTNKGTRGLAHALEHLVFKRTAKFTARDIAERFESLGAFVNAYTSNEYTCFYVRALSYHYEEVFELMSELIQNTVFNPAEVEREKNVILQEISASQDDPEDFIFDTADELLFGNHPFGFSILGTKKTLKNVTIERLEEFRQKFYTPDKMIICTVGNIKHNLIMQLTKKHFNHIPRSTDKAKPKALPELKHNEKTQVILKQPIHQVHTVYGKRYEKAERLPAAFVSMVLGDGMSSRLYQKIRDEEGLAYSVYTSMQSYSLCGLFYIYASSDNKNQDILISKIKVELEKIRKDGITYEEYLRAKEQLKSGFALEMEDLSSRMQSLSKKFVLYGEIVNVSDIFYRYDNVTYDEVSAFAKKLSEDEHWYSVLLVPED
ncbi:MAG: pitrilysin family protein [bacterium]